MPYAIQCTRFDSRLKKNYHFYYHGACTGSGATVVVPDITQATLFEHRNEAGRVMRQAFHNQQGLEVVKVYETSRHGPFTLA